MQIFSYPQKFYSAGCKTNSISLLLCLQLICGLFSSTSYASSTHVAGHIEVKNRTPVVSLFQLSRADYLSLDDGAYMFSTLAEASNYLSSSNKQDGFFGIDGESYFYEQRVTHRKGKQLFTLSIPYTVHTSGFLDRVIFDFHDIFGLPQNGRTDQNHDRQFWRLTADGETLIDLDGREQGIGDISFSYGHILDDSSQASLSIKLPTGDFESQTGSEGWDIGISYSQMNPDWLKQRTWLKEQSLSFWWGGSFNYLSEADGLERLDALPIVLTGRLGFGWAPFENWSIKAQIDANSPLFDNDIRELGWIPVQASFSSAHFFLKRKHKVEFMIAEDLRPRTTPDVVFGLLYQFQI